MAKAFCTGRPSWRNLSLSLLPVPQPPVRSVGPWQQLCHALPPLQICCLRTALYHNSQLASMICRLLRSILEKCNIASRHCTVLYLPLDSVFLFSPVSQLKKTRARGSLCYKLWHVRPVCSMHFGRKVCTCRQT